MLMTKIVLVLLLLSIFVNRDVEAFEPISTLTAAAMAGVVSVMYGAYEFFNCRRFECCSHGWIMNNSTGLKQDLQKMLYGQHLVVSAVYGHVKAHVNPDWQPQKALALSFNGLMGTGKNYVAKIIAENLYEKGMKSEFVHLFSGTREFPHANRVKEYKDRIRTVIEANVKKCPQSLFIFDEMEKVPAGLIDAIRPYLQPYETLAGVDYRRAIFLFLGNIGGENIARYALKEWRQGRLREKITLKDVEYLIAESAAFSGDQMGFEGSDLIHNSMITAYIPFLPLTRAHVRQCIEDVFLQRRYSHRRQIPRDLVDEVLANLHFQPEEERTFSTSGCKRVAEKVDLVLHSDEL